MPKMKLHVDESAGAPMSSVRDGSCRKTSRETTEMSHTARRFPERIKGFTSLRIQRMVALPLTPKLAESAGLRRMG
ncbi:hypothetical protein [Rhodoferax koreensis]|uniref:hypothetical protein n=1 Tax=Rhodoferax koreensis TaxID=1842727 RepID=UPI0012FF954D|nr:hypothetical protein [Rhodoferax koreense]